MTADLRPYPEYKDSGLPWLGQAPTHWEVRRNGRLFAQRNETGYGSLPILEVSLKTGVRVRDMDDLKRKQVMSDREKYKRAVKGDIAYNMMRMWQGAVGVAPVDGLVSPAYVVARPYPEADSRYFSYLFRTNAYMSEVDGYSRGIVKDRNRLYWEDFKRIPSCTPPLEEQKAIADYLDANAIKVRRFIRNRRRLIEVLNEQKQAIINRAVTRGLDPNAPLKPSGIDWLGDIPEHWEVHRLRRLAAVRLSSVDKVVVEEEKPVRLCNYVDVYHNDVIREDIDFMLGSATDAEIEAFQLRAGDVLITKDSEEWEDIAVPAFVPKTLQSVVCGYHLAVVRPRKDVVDGEYLARAFSAESIAIQFRVAANGVTRYGLPQEAIKGAFFPVPPVEEQRGIVDHIHEQCNRIQAAISKAEKEIALIREYRTRLIADVVTGKVDVRQVVADELVEVSSMPAKPKRTANIYFQRSVFAAEIVHRLHEEPTFGHVKFEKLIFLCERQCGVDTGSTYHRQAAGPYDNRALRSIDSQIKKQQWYAAQKQEKRYQYVPLAKAGEHKTYFDRYFSDVEERFSRLIEKFRKLETKQCEIVATLYGAWEDLLGGGAEATDDLIVEQVLHHWHPSKQQIDEDRWRRALQWMKQEGLVPNVTGAAEAVKTESLDDDEDIGDETPDEDEEGPSEEEADADD